MAVRALPPPQHFYVVRFLAHSLAALSSCPQQKMPKNTPAIDEISTEDREPDDGTRFERVIRHFLETPPKPCEIPGKDPESSRKRRTDR